MQNNKINSLHKSATNNANELLSYLGVNPQSLVTSNDVVNTLWIHTYPQVCEMLGMVDCQECTDPYDYENGNGEQYDEEGRLFTLIVFAVNQPGDNGEFFWVEYIFRNNFSVEVRIGATSVHSQYCDQVLVEIVGVKQGHIFNFKEAGESIAKLHKILKKDVHYFEGYL